MNTTTTRNLPDLATLESALDLARQIDAMKAKLSALFSPTTTKRKYSARKGADYWTPELRAAKARQMRRWHREQGGAK